MPGKKKGKKFSVDEYLSGYHEKKKALSEDEEGVEGALARRREEKERKSERDVGYRRQGLQPEEEKEATGWAVGVGGKVGALEQTEALIVKNKLAILATYALRAFAIALMGYLMLFVILHDVMGKRSVIDYFSKVTDSFIPFVNLYMTSFLAVLGVLFGLQLAYYLFYWFANKNWKSYTREEIVYTIAFSLAGLAGSALVVYGLGY